MFSTASAHPMTGGAGTSLGGTNDGDRERTWQASSAPERHLELNARLFARSTKHSSTSSQRSLSDRQMGSSTAPHSISAGSYFREFAGVLDILRTRPRISYVWPPTESDRAANALASTLALEQNAIGFNPMAGAILGRIFDRGHATCGDLADWIESPDEWIAFSRLQRARLLYDSGTEFSVSPAGRKLIQRLLSEGEAE